MKSGDHQYIWQADDWPNWRFEPGRSRDSHGRDWSFTPRNQSWRFGPRCTSEDHDRGTIFFRKDESLYCKIVHFLDGIRRKNNLVIIPVAAALGCLKIVRLRRGDIAKAWSAALNIDYYGWKFSAGQE